MKIIKQESLKIKLKGKDIDTFKQVLKKLNNTEKKVGFTNTPFNEDENKLLSSLNDKV